MKKYLKLKKIISIVLICVSINIFQGCTSIQENLVKILEVIYMNRKNT